MKKLMIAFIPFIIIIGCFNQKPVDIIYQTSTIDALLAGVYDGEVTLQQLIKHGDFGIGTFDGLDGEMLVFEGNLFQVKADGKVYQPLLSDKTPFATVCQFHSDRQLEIDTVNFSSLKEMIDLAEPNQNLFYAIQVKGQFHHVKTRSVPGQTKPYPPLSEVTKNQPEFEMSDLSGTLIGFRCPPFVQGINVPGYHLHFLSDDHTQGGHVLSFECASGICNVDVIDQYFLELPETVDAFADTDLSKDRGEELEAVEN